MKKGIKIALISLGSLLGLVVVTVAVACWLVFTPARLTSIVNKLSDKYLLCQSHFDKVDLTLFKTFPDAGLELHNVVLVNPTQGAPSDTLASISNLTVGINLKQFLASRQVVVHQIRIDNPSACLYIAPDGSNNFSVIQTSQDTSSSTTELPSVIQIEKVAIHHLNGSFVNSPNHMQAALKDLDLNLKGSLLDKAVDAQLKLDANRIALHLADSVGSPRLVADLADLALQLSAKGDKSDLQGELRLSLPDGEFSLNGTCYTPEAMRNAKGDLLSLMVPFRGSLDSLQVSLSKAYLQLLDYRINLDGSAQLARQDRPLTMDVDFSTNTWQVADLLPILPAQFTKWKKGMDLDARLQLQGRCSGTVSDSTLPLVHADVRLDKGLFALPKTLPNKVKNISADLTADLDLKHKDNSSALIRSLSAQMGSNKLRVKGKVDKLLGDMLIDAQIGGDLALDEVRELLPAKLPLSLRGDADVDLAVNSSLKHITHTDLTKIKAKGTLHFSHLDAVYDSIFATAPQLNVAVQLPVAKRSNKVGELLGAHITGSDLHVKMPKNQIDATIASPDIDVNLNNLLDKSKPLAAAFDIALGTLHVDKDSLDADAQRLALKGSMRYDKTKGNILQQLDPDLDITLTQTRLKIPALMKELRLPEFVFAYSPTKCQITNANLLWGKSDYQFYGTVNNLEQWLNHERSLFADLHFVANEADIDELLNTLSGMGSNKDTLEQQRKEDKVDAAANPFIVPRDVDATLHTHIKHCVAFGNEISDLGGTVMVKDGVAVLDQMGFVCKAARMQLTALYKSPRPNNLFVGLDFHLLDIQIHELLDMIPSVDSLVPMLAVFDGKADFHLAGESFLNAYYQPKMSSLLGSAAISGKDLVVLDNEKTANILKLLQVKDWRQKDNKLVIDSLDVEMTAFRKEIEVFPFMLHVGKYNVCASGKHNLDNQCNYHLELLESPLPVRLAVDIKGSLKKPAITLGSVRYANLYRPEKRNATQERTLQLKQLIREALERNVR